jgi:hypothetical protein
MTVTLDAFAQERGWFDKPDLSIAILKLDAEGKSRRLLKESGYFSNQGSRSNRALSILTKCRRLGRKPIQTAIKTLLDTGHTLVHMNRQKFLRRISKDLGRSYEGTAW